MKKSLLCFAWCLGLAAGSAWAQSIGKIEKATGNVVVVNAAQVKKEVGSDYKVSPGDSVVTSASSEALIRMSDDTVISLRPNTTFQINQFSTDEKSGLSSVMSLFRGVARIVTGKIAKLNPSKAVYKGGTATVGIRGTDFELAVIPEDSKDARAGVYNRVIGGGTTIQIASGEKLDVAPKQTAFAPEKPKPGEAPLSLLDTTPAFLLDGGGLDTLIESISSSLMGAGGQF